MTMRTLVTILTFLACGAPPQPPPPDAGCTLKTVFYPDADGDGFGDANSAGTEGCLGAPPGGYVINRLDCADGDARANPNQATPQTTPIVGITTNRWDFNCDGKVDLQYPSTPAFCSGTSLCAGSNNTWRGDPASRSPACGVAGTWILDCRFSVSQCVAAGTTPRTQGCL